MSSIPTNRIWSHQESALRAVHMGFFFRTLLLIFKKASGEHFARSTIARAECITCFPTVRQLNMDYSITNAVKWNTEGIVCILIIYDIMCQYWVNIQRRLEANKEWIDFPQSIEEFKRGIGLFHVHGHVQECFCRFAPLYIEGAGTIDGERMESLWKPIREMIGSTRSMSAAHRKEALNDHMNDNNWKKLTRIGMTIYSFIARALSNHF